MGLLLAVVFVAVWPSEAHGDLSNARARAELAGRLDASVSYLGQNHTCAISADGTLRCWGANSFGQAGYGHTSSVGNTETPAEAGPIDLGPGRTAKAVTALHNTTCAILDNGTVRCWGLNNFGQLGYGNATNIGDNETPAAAGPVNFGEGRTAVAISGGGFHTCAILDNGTVKCWGEGGASLGYGHTQVIGDNETLASVPALNLGEGRTAVAIAAGTLHTCAILDNGTVRCWGLNGYGQLGVPGGSIGDNEAPAAAPTVNIGAGRTAVAISAGHEHTCVILDNGAVKCWGKGEGGRLGYGTGSGAPVYDAGLHGTVDLGAGRTAVAISAGALHTCAILDNGSTRCWGSTEWGLLGYGNTPMWGSEPIGDNETPGSVPPLDLGTGREGVAITASAGHTCELLDNGTMPCWGADSTGQLGYAFGVTEFWPFVIGDDETPGQQGPLDLGGGHGALETAAGGAHTCALFDQGEVRCWGKGTNGRLGYGNTNTIGDDENVGSAGAVELGGGVTEVGAGNSHTCALLAEGAVRCWGSGANGRLGTGNTNDLGDNEVPSSVGAVSLGESAVQIAVGGSHSCALLAAGSVRCWGLGSSGQLGYGNTNDVGDNEVPSAVSAVNLGGRTAISISAGGEHTCAMLDNRTIRCWGKGVDGRLGYANQNTIGDNESPSFATTVNVGASAGDVATGGSHTCSVLTTGALRCWGLASSGQLGYGATVDIGDNESPAAAGPVNFGGPSTSSVATGASHTCARLAGGSVRCWGLNGDGQLGLGHTNTIGDNEPITFSLPVDVGAFRTALNLSAGAAHTCATLNEGSVRCWGSGADGRLGYGDTKTIGDNETPGTAGPIDFIDDLPVAANDSTTVTEDSGANAVGVLANDTDTDGGPKLVASKTNGSHGTVAITGGGTGLTYQPAANYCGADSFTYTLNGGSTATVSVTVTCVDDLPVAVNDSATVAEDSSATVIDVLTNDTDVDGGAKSVASKTNGAHGAVVLLGGGLGLSYQPDPNYCGSDSFTYTLNGGSVGTVSITVTCSDDVPVAVNDSAALAEDSTATAIDVLGNDTDIDLGPKAISGASSPNHGTVALTGGSPGAHTGLTYQPAANYCGSDSFTYTLNGGSQATVSVTVTCVDDLPVAVNDSATVEEDAAPTAIGVLGNDTDIDSGPKTIASASDPDHGTVALTGGSPGAHTGLTYQPDANYCGPDSFAYELNGGSTATVSVTVNCVDDAAVAVGDSATVNEDSATQGIDVLANDTDVDGGSKSIVGKNNGSHGAVTITGGGTGLTYTPDADYCGADSFTYTLNGGSTATVSVTVTCVDDLPVAVDDSATVAEDAAATAIGVLANDTDIDSGPKSIAGASDPDHGAVALTGGSPGAHTGLTYAPDPNYCGPDSFTYSLNGGSSATVSVTVSCVDDLPAAIDDAATVAEDAGATAIDVLANDTDTDGGPKLVASKTNGSHGTVAVTGGGTGLTYVPDANYCGADTFTYTLNGGSTATVSVTVTCVDDAPVAVDDTLSLNEDATATSVDVLANDTDIDGGAKSVAGKSNGAHGTVVITGSGLTYQPDSNYCGPDSFTYSLNGGSTATVSVTVNCADDSPSAVDDAATVAEDAPATAINVLANDTDPDAGSKTIASKTDGAHGSVAITGGGSGITYQPQANYCGADSFTYTLNGGSTATVSVTVTCVDDAPVAVGDADTVLEDSSPTAIDVLANDTDIDGGAKSVVGKTNGSHGAVALLGGGAGLTYQPDPDYCGPDTFTYTLNGGSQATVSIGVTCVDEPAPPGGGGSEQGGGGGSVQNIFPADASGPVVNVTPGVGVVSGRRHPRIAIKGIYAFFTLTCRLSEKDCAGVVTITATVPSIALGPTMEKVTLIKGRFRIGPSRSVLVRAKLTPKGLEVLKAKRTLRGVASKMAIVDAGNGERGEIVVNLVRRPKASLLPGESGRK